MAPTDFRRVRMRVGGAYPLSRRMATGMHEPASPSALHRTLRKISQLSSALQENFRGRFQGASDLGNVYPGCSVVM